MARLAYTQVDGGATDSRTLWALQRKLAGTGLRSRYQRLDATSLVALPKPCLVQLDWGYFISHMVPVMEATADRVVIGDPLSGRREMTMAEFVAKWKGNAICLEQGEAGKGSR
jgi:predicted double-glycine peptidase